MLDVVIDKLIENGIEKNFLTFIQIPLCLEGDNLVTMPLTVLAKQETIGTNQIVSSYIIHPN